MLRETTHKICRAVVCTAIMNFLLFGLISFALGGDALGGKVEEGRYYLGSHGHYTDEVHYVIFLYSKLHNHSVFVSMPLLVLASFIYWITKGRDKEFSTTVTSKIKQPPQKAVLYGLHIVNLLLWKASDFVEGVFWVLFDSWREPNVEFCTRFSVQECIVKLSEALDYGKFPFDQFDRPIVGSLSGSHFYLFERPSYIPSYGRLHWGSAVILALFGKFSVVSQCTCVRAWHRLPTIGMLLMALFFGTASSALTLLILSSAYSVFVALGIDLTSTATFWALIPSVLFRMIVPLLIVIFLLSSIMVSSSMGQTQNADLARFLRHVLEDEFSDSTLREVTANDSVTQ